MTSGMKWVKFTFFLDELQVHKQPALVRNMLGSYQGSRRSYQRQIFKDISVSCRTRRFTNYYPNLDCRSFNRFLKAIYESISFGCCLHAETFTEPSQTYKMKLFEKIFLTAKSR